MLERIRVRKLCAALAAGAMFAGMVQFAGAQQAGKTDKRCLKIGSAQACKTAIQSNNVEVDDRGYIYVVDRANTGMHILELSGEARKVANFK